MISKLLYIFLFISLSITTVKAQFVSAERIYTQVENMPRMCECATAKDNMYKLDKCTVTALSRWMTENMNYPQAALEKGTQGICRIRVVIDTAGRLSSPLLMDNVSPACDEEALKLVNILSNQPDAFFPGTQARKKVKVSLIIPVEFNTERWKKEVTRRQKLLEEALKQDSTILKRFMPEIKD